MPAPRGYAFGPFRLTASPICLLGNGEPIPISDRQGRVLLRLAQSGGATVSKGDLMAVGWPEQIVSDSSLEKLVCGIRTTLSRTDRRHHIATKARSGYQLVTPVTPIAPAPLDLANALARQNALIEGRAALESLALSRITQARDLFDRLVNEAPGQAECHVGLAMAYAMQFDGTRADVRPDMEALERAETHTLRACELNQDLAEAWASLGYVRARMGRHTEAIAAFERALLLDAGNFHHLYRLSESCWGERKLRSVRLTLDQCPHLPAARFQSAMLYVARCAHRKAEREVDAALAVSGTELEGHAALAAVGLHLLKALLCFDRAAVDDAYTWVERELAGGSLDHLYGREVLANASIAKGAMLLGSDNRDAAAAAFKTALIHVPGYLRARAGLEMLGQPAGVFDDTPEAATHPMDAASARAAVRSGQGRRGEGAALLAAALRAAPPGSAGWLIPIDPLLRVSRDPGAWAPATTVLQLRAR